MNMPKTSIHKQDLLNYKNEAEQEWTAILSWWQNNMLDDENGGFFGSVNNQNQVDGAAAKGIVLNSRICWAFSAAYLHFGHDAYFQVAKMAFSFIQDFFIDKEYGGVFWSVDVKGNMLDSRKQIYGLAFTIYALAEYYRAVRDEEALSTAINLFTVIEQYSFDPINSGYIEAFARDWSATADLRISAKDDNEKKTMNTHLHIIEAYANLFTVWPNDALKKKICSLLENFQQYMINPQNNHLNLFMDESWKVQAGVISYGHDVEAAWLLEECARITGETTYIEKFKNISIQLIRAASEGWDKEGGGLWYEFEPATGQLIQEKHWWPQAEAMVGYLNAYQLTGQQYYLQQSLLSFNFIKAHLKDYKNGEWFWGIYKNGSLIDKEKAGFWKCPYHNSRACQQISKRIAEIVTDEN